MGLFEVNEAAEVVTSAADQNANVIFGAVIDGGLKDEVRVTVIATGFGPGAHRRRRKTTVEEPAPARSRPEAEEPFELPKDVLEVPSFLRE
jgi:cell division protein FtsZ